MSNLSPVRGGKAREAGEIANAGVTAENRDKKFKNTLPISGKLAYNKVKLLDS